MMAAHRRGARSHFSEVSMHAPATLLSILALLAMAPPAMPASHDPYRGAGDRTPPAATTHDDNSLATHAGNAGNA
jgi:hypothetical protein